MEQHLGEEKNPIRSYKLEGISLIRSLNVHDMSFRYKKLAFIDEDQANKLSNVEVLPDDVLLNITGASIARCCVVPQQVLPARVNQHVSIIRLISDQLDAKFLNYLLVSKFYKDQLLLAKKEARHAQRLLKHRSKISRYITLRVLRNNG